MHGYVKIGDGKRAMHGIYPQAALGVYVFIFPTLIEKS